MEEVDARSSLWLDRSAYLSKILIYISSSLASGRTSFVLRSRSLLQLLWKHANKLRWLRFGHLHLSSRAFYISFFYKILADPGMI